VAPHSIQMRGFPNEAVLKQISSRQPPILLWCVCFFVPAWLLSFISGLLMRWPTFVDIASTHHIAYSICFLAAQMGLLVGATWLLSNRYREALWTPEGEPLPQGPPSMLLILPLLLYNFSEWFTVPAFLTMFSVMPAERTTVYQEIWNGLAYGSSLTGVICNSVASFVAPLWEEVLFSGLLANRFAAWLGNISGILVTPACFALVHVLQFGFGTHLVELYFAGVAYTAVRFRSGRLGLSVLCHMLVNFVVFVPKWAVAVAYFRHI
jgi:membrane protease YdiL (CAAX protease family)